MLFLILSVITELQEFERGTCDRRRSAYSCVCIGVSEINYVKILIQEAKRAYIIKDPSLLMTEITKFERECSQ
jgi:hypothetical protein